METTIQKIYFLDPIYGTFRTLRQAVRGLKKRSFNGRLFLPQIVQCNISYRDHLRDHGLDSLVGRLIEEAPELAGEPAAIDELRDWWMQTKQLASYDIQCYDIHDPVTILGHEFKGLADVRKHRLLCGHDFYDGFRCYEMKNVQPLAGIHIGEIYENYPVFDSDDLGDERTYQNYFFRRSLITPKEMECLSNLNHLPNFCMVHEHLPKEVLPILYYGGDGHYMLLATHKGE